MSANGSFAATFPKPSSTPCFSNAPPGSVTRENTPPRRSCLDERLVHLGFSRLGAPDLHAPPEQLIVGAVLAALALAPFGRAIGPRWFLTPRRVLAVVRLVAATSGRVAIANVKLSARIWNPRRPLSSGTIVVATHEHNDGDLAAMGLISALVVDNQIVDRRGPVVARRKVGRERNTRRQAERGRRHRQIVSLPRGVGDPDRWRRFAPFWVGVRDTGRNVSPRIS